MSDINELEQQLKNAKELVDLRNQALRLAENRDFRKLILDGFCRDDLVRFANQAGDPALTDRQRADAAEMAKAPGHLRRYLSAIVTMGHTAEREVAEVEEALEEARREGDIEDTVHGDDGPEA